MFNNVISSSVNCLFLRAITIFAVSKDSSSLYFLEFLPPPQQNDGIVVDKNPDSKRIELIPAMVPVLNCVFIAVFYSQKGLCEF